MSTDRVEERQMEPPASLLFKPRIQLRRALIELWQGRELVRALVEREFRARLRIDTPHERDYLRHGGILPYALRKALGR